MPGALRQTLTQPASTPASIGIAFDQIDRIIPGSGTPPPMNHFDADLAAIRAYQSATLMPSQAEISQQMAMMAAQEALSLVASLNPFAGAAIAAAQQAQARAMQKRAEERIKTLMGPDPGTYSSYYLYNGWVRVEVPNLVVILRPDRHQQIYINPVKKTYRILDTSTTPPPAPDTGETVPPNPARTTVAMVGSQTDGATIDDQVTSGFRLDATTTLSGGIDPCVDGTYRATQLEYFRQTAEPLPGSIADGQGFYALTLPQDCYVTLTPALSGPLPPYQQMYVYRLVTVVRDAALAAGPTPSPKQVQEANLMRSMFGSASGPGPNYMKFSERGNIRALSATDASLFEIPADYIEVK